MSRVDGHEEKVDAGEVSNAEAIASFLSPYAADVLRCVAAGEESPASRGLILENTREELAALRLTCGEGPTPLGRLVVDRLPQRRLPSPPPKHFAMTVRIDPTVIIRYVLWDLLPPEDRGIDWCRLEGWHVPPSADRSWLPPDIAVLTPQLAARRAAYPLDPGEYIHEACVAPLLGGYVDLRVTADGEHAGQILRLDRPALERGIALTADGEDPVSWPGGDWHIDPWGDEEFLQQCLFGEVVFKSTRHL